MDAGLPEDYTPQEESKRFKAVYRTDRDMMEKMVTTETAFEALGQVLGALQRSKICNHEAAPCSTDSSVHVGGRTGAIQQRADNAKTKENNIRHARP